MLTQEQLNAIEQLEREDMRATLLRQDALAHKDHFPLWVALWVAITLGYLLFELLKP